MAKIFVIGGTRFFGKRLVNKLLEEGHEVTVATRGNTPIEWGDEVFHVTMDRNDPEQLKKAIQDHQYDIVYDQVCFSPDEAKEAVEIFQGKVKKYVFTSTLSVYGLNEEPWNEEDFDPHHYPIRYGNKDQFDYAEGKRLAEAVFFQEADFPVVAVRIPIVMGTDDYTQRLWFHIEKIKQGEPFFVRNLAAKMGYISSEESADFLKWIGSQTYEGPINAIADGTISIGELITLIEQKANQKAILSSDETKNPSPYSPAQSFYMSNKKAKELGFTFSHLSDWLPPLIEELITKSK